MSDRIYKFVDYKNTHVVIEASAGTGKTYTIEQIIPQMIEAGVTIDKIAVLTFTEKAAAELQDRIRRGLSNRFKEVGLDSRQSNQLIDAIESLPNAKIGTIHHFCRTILKKYSLKIGLSSKFGEIRNSREEIETYFKKFWGKIEKDDSEDLINLLRIVDYSNFKETIISLADKLSGKKVKLLDLPDVKSGIDSNFSELKALLTNCDLSKDKPLYVEKLNEFNNKKYSNSLDKISAIKYNFLTGSLDPNKNVMKFILGSNSISESDYSWLLKSLIDDLEKDLFTTILNPILEYANQFIEEYETHLLTNDMLSLDGLILKTRDLVADSAIRKEIQREIKYLILDECQDTNPIQMNLITTLFTGLNTGIIFVGDPKQSIYRFRDADINSYRKAVNSLVKKEELSLSKSFRSSKKLVDAFNFIFPFLADLSKVYKTIEANRKDIEFNKDISPPIIFLGLDSDNKPITKDKEGKSYTADGLREESLNEIVNVIHHIVDNENYLIQDKKDGNTKGRRIKFSDITVLSRGKKGLNTLLREFSRNSISANIYKSPLFYSNKIIQAISFLLHSVENPSDSTSLYKALASELFLIPESLLFQLSEAQELTYLSNTKNEEINAIYDSLRKAHENRYIKDVSYTMMEILKENRVLEVLSIGFEGKRNLANIYHLSEILSYAQLTENLSFGEIVRRLKSDVENSVEQEIKIDNDKKDESFNSVQLMTIHASKGLEFPVCILYDLASSPKSDTTSLFIKDKELKKSEIEVDLKLKLINNSELKTPNFTETFKANTSELNLEFERLLYVAFTRAMDYLVIPLHTQEKLPSNSIRQIMDNAFSSDIINNLLNQDLAINFKNLKTTKSANSGIKPKEFKIEKIENGEYHLFSISSQEINAKSGIKMQSYSSIARHLESEEEKVKEKIVIEKNALPENESNSKSTYTLGPEKRGTTFGLLCHSVMENFDLKFITNQKKIKEQVEIMVNEYYPDTGLEDIADYTRLDAIEICTSALQKSYSMNSEYTEFSYVKDWKYFVREKSFYYKIKSSKMDCIIGIGDGMFYWKNKYYILDWKTNLIRTDENESVDQAIEKKVKESYYYQYMIYSMNLMDNILFNKTNKEKIWEEMFGGMLFVFMRIKEDNKGSFLVKPSYQDLQNFKKELVK